MTVTGTKQEGWFTKMEITVTLTDEQAAEIPDLQTYAESLANDRLIRKADRERFAKMNDLIILSDEELADAYTAKVSEIIAGMSDEQIAASKAAYQGKLEG
jgi:hypothetical protein